MTSMAFEVTGVSVPLLKVTEMVSAVSSARLVNVATPPETVALSVPCEWARSVARRAADDRAVVACLEVAESILFVDHRLDAERLAGRGGRGRLGRITNRAAAAGLIAKLLLAPEGARAPSVAERV